MIAFASPHDESQNKQIDRKTAHHVALIQLFILYFEMLEIGPENNIFQYVLIYGYILAPVGDMGASILFL